MKARGGMLLIFLSVLLFTTTAVAAPMYYKFEGHVTDIYDRTGSIAEDYGNGFNVGSVATYTFMIDFDVDGQYTLVYNDLTLTLTDTDNAPHYTTDYFYTQLISGTTVDIEGTGYYETTYAGSFRTSLNYGSDRYDTYRDQYDFTAGSLSGGDMDAEVLLYSLDTHVHDWAVGTTLQGKAGDWAANRVADFIYSDLTLVDISETYDYGPGPAPAPAPVPEPSTLLLLGSGLASLASFPRRRKNK